VHSTLRALFSDLEIRCDVLLGNLPASSEEPVAKRVAELSTKVTMVRSEAAANLRSALENPSLAQVHYDDYAKLNRTLVSVEQFELPAIMRWGEPDREITEMCTAFLGQVGWPFTHPLVATVSHEYYVALPSRSIVYVPENENERLLAVGDLAHELGHIVLERETSRLVRDTPSHIMALAGTLAASSSEPSRRAFEVGTTWVKWLTEFICDSVATYLTGPAFPLQNLRLCGMQNVLLEAFNIDDGRSHPPDDARMQLALQTLRGLRMEEQATQIGELWVEAVAVTGAVPDAAYTEMFPAELLETVARNVHTGCAELGLRAYDPAITESCDVARMAAAAWEQLLADPAGYAAWERERLAACRPSWAA
jgi:hypothetical protein